MKFLNKQHIFYQSGFTLIELIIVIAVIALLAAATFVAVDPAKRIGMARDAQRWQDVTAISDAIQLYIADNNGTFPTSTALFDATGDTSYPIMGVGTGGITDSSCSSFLANMEYYGVLLDNLVPTYLPTMPVDPMGLLGSLETRYFFKWYGGSKFLIGACEKSDYTTNWISIKR